MKDALIHHYVGLQLLLDYNKALKAFTTHLKISHIYELIFTKFIANRKYVLKINEQLLKRTSAQNPLDETPKKKWRGGWHPPPPSLVRARVNPQTARTFIISLKRGTICLFVCFLFIVLLCFVLCGFFIFAFHTKRSLELGKYYFISPKAGLPLKTSIYTTKTLGHCRDR